jgi:flagellar hook-associated protein 2
MAINLSGLASGLPTDELIANLMSLERQPRTRVVTQRTNEQSMKTALQGVADQLKKLQTAAQALADPTLFGNKQSVEIGNAATATATLVSGAPTGGYSLQVDRLARSAQASYAFTPPTADGTIELAGTGWTDSIAVKADEKASDLVARINGNPALHVVASVTTVDGVERLSFASRATGATSGFTASAAGVLSDEALKAGLDASVRVDGQVHTSSTNVLEGAIPGVKLQLRGLDSVGTTVNVGAPGADTKSVGDAAKAFVDAYNASNDLLRKLTAVSATSKGQLGGDSTLTAMQNQLRSAMVSVSGGVSTLPLEKLGISTGKASGTATYSADAIAGKLKFDADVLSAAVTADPAAVRSVLGANDGVLKSLATTIGTYTGASGSLTERISASDKTIADLGRRMDDFDARLTAKEAALKAQFSRLESTISKFNDQRSWLTGQLNALNPR